MALLALCCLALAAVACSPDDDAPSTVAAPPSLEQIVAAVRKPGMVFHAEATVTQSGYGAQEPVTLEEWYSADEGATRTASSVSGAAGETTIYRDDRETMYDPASHEAYPPAPPGERPAGAPDGGIAGLQHLHLFLSKDGYRFIGRSREGGNDVLRFEASHVVTREEAYELAAGTAFHYTLVLRAADLLPVSLGVTVDTSAVPTPKPPVTAGPALPSSSLEYTKVEFLDRSSLPGDFFDPAALGTNANQ